MVKRQLEKQLFKTFWLFPAVAILGPRQVGKTTLAKQVGKALAKKNNLP